MASPTSAPTRQLPRVERRASILHAAARAFAEEGYTATSMEDIATESGVTKLIVYRHFESKEALYRAVLDGVSTRLAEEFAGAFRPVRRPGGGARAFLTVAREDPHGFRLLWRHAAREAAFAEYAGEFRRLAVEAARSLLAPLVPDEALHRWAAETIVTLLVESVLHWLEWGDAERDEQFVELTTASISALIGTWGEAPKPRGR